MKLPDTGEDIWYRTGDLGKRDSTGILHFLGRVDEQIKINGFRVELLEVEAVLRRVSSVQDVAVILQRDSRGGIDSLIAFLCDTKFDPEYVLAECRKELPSYACPRKFIAIDKIPLNDNGKVNRKALELLNF